MVNRPLQSVAALRPPVVRPNRVAVGQQWEGAVTQSSGRPFHSPDSRGQLAIATVRTDAPGNRQVVLSYLVGPAVVSEPMFTIAANDWASVEALEFDEHDEPVVLFTQKSGLALLR